MKNFIINWLFKSFVFESLLLATFCFLSSCSDDQPKDVIVPDVMFTNLTANQVVWNTVPINLTVNDNASIATVDLFVDDSIVKSFTTAPYETSWDSNTVSDGTHTIKVVVTDRSGNLTEKQVDIVIKNVLVKIDIARDQIWTVNGIEGHGYIFLSDETGRVIAFKECRNGDHIELKSPGFNGETFYLTEVFTGNLHQPLISLTTFAGISRGQKWAVWSNDGPYADVSEQQRFIDHAGSADLKFSGSVDGYYYEFSTTKSQGYASESMSCQVGLVKNPGKLYVVRKDQNKIPLTYGLYSDIDITKMNTIDLGLANRDLKKVTIAIPGITNEPLLGSVNVTGYLQANSYDEPYYLGEFSQVVDHFDVYYPYTEFASYYIKSIYHTDNMNYRRGVYNEFSHVIPEHTVNFSFQNNKLTYSGNGRLDVLGAIYNTETGEGNWTIMLPPASNLSIPVIQLPEQLKALSYTPALNGRPQRYRVFEFEGINGYEGLKSFIGSSQHSINELEANNKTFIDVTLVN